MISDAGLPPTSMVFPTSQIYIYDCLESTNDTLWELLEAGAPPGTVVIARQQTAGKGQWGRQWESSLGGLYLSWAIQPSLPASDGVQLTFSSVWGIAQVLDQWGIPVRIKWPNDLILDQRKLGGILIETKMTQGMIYQAVIGVGINWANPVPEMGINLQTFLKTLETPKISDWDSLKTLILQGLIRGYEVLESEGMAGLLPQYESFLSNIGEIITVNGQTGTIIGVASTGELRVKLHSVTLEVHPKSVADDGTEIQLPPGTIRLGYKKKPKK